ncbi:hypothetical protein [Bifidobacterium bohemicum]|nr:hypothetical protein [Bifidobacterium bohemicum]
MEAHLRDDVPVLYSPSAPITGVTMRLIGTHKELRTGHFGAEMAC